LNALAMHGRLIVIGMISQVAFLDKRLNWLYFKFYFSFFSFLNYKKITVSSFITNFKITWMLFAHHLGVPFVKPNYFTLASDAHVYRAGRKTCVCSYLINMKNNLCKMKFIIISMEVDGQTQCYFEFMRST
jgi:hypothetical protein